MQAVFQIRNSHSPGLTLPAFTGKNMIPKEVLQLYLNDIDKKVIVRRRRCL